MAKSPEIVMVTGAAGFVGSHLIERLLALGQTVHGLDIAPLAEARNLEAVKDHPNFHYMQGDIRDPEVDPRPSSAPRRACSTTSPRWSACGATWRTRSASSTSPSSARAT